MGKQPSARFFTQVTKQSAWDALIQEREKLASKPQKNRTYGRELIMLTVMLAILTAILAKFTMEESANIGKSSFKH